jgi:hypothetical protein
LRAWRLGAKRKEESVSREGAKGAKLKNLEERVFFASLASWRDKQIRESDSRKGAKDAKE